MYILEIKIIRLPRNIDIVGVSKKRENKDKINEENKENLNEK